MTAVRLLSDCERVCEMFLTPGPLVIVLKRSFMQTASILCKEVLEGSISFLLVFHHGEFIDVLFKHRILPTWVYRCRKKAITFTGISDAFVRLFQTLLRLHLRVCLGDTVSS